ncbi:putative prophage AlpA transcriptional regulator [Pseudomonas fluorescens Pf0-1]|uniref:Putative prophage AlpA transcriptional regulator n=2 Tax=Pseudomonas fluorescens TaxID=294 RepID=Q3KBX3_PSEPF|nr:putative prophage AlpA transcriptional regulator [Pseudomonas fluorescens Pf0-1]
MCQSAPGVTSMSSQYSPIVEAPQLQVERHIMRRDEVERKTGFKRAHIYNLMKEGKFPQAKRIGLRAVGWDSLEIERWIVERLGHQV